MLSISDQELSRLDHALQISPAPFVTITSMSNQTVAIRTKAIADLFASHDDNDHFGPEDAEHRYEDHIPWRSISDIVTNNDWKIVEALALQLDIDSNIDDAAIERMVKIINNLPDGLQKQTLDLAITMTYQLSNGRKRQLWINDCPDDLFMLFDSYEHDEDCDSLIRLTGIEAWALTYINTNALDYLSIPTHIFEAPKKERD
jgi:hypothetical protein